MMEARKLSDCPERDRDEIQRVIDEYGSAHVLRIGDLLGSDAREFMLRYRKEHGDLPAHDQVWVA